ncbi:Hypothetical protein, putative [Bodo saltans]|uniref:Uncharacterized protein n=1 Tax=Bodo saltans TaxID=75058 RepID=A0A0S4KI72_BODSA|nr:Hypothetical protein, putative [Bodo saltans]|eukprot:CUI15387.1 Hypothetical protein, putative [Bodo saltans]
MSEYVYRATAAADRSSNSGSVTRREINRDRIESLSAIDASMSLLQVASHRQPNTASSGPIDSRGGQQLEQASSVFGASGPQFLRRPEAEQSQAHGAHRMTRREHIVQELQRIVILLVGNRSSSSSSPERQNTSASPRRQNTLTGSVVISQNNSFASAAVPSGSLSAVTASAPGDGTTGRQDSIISTTTSTSTPAAVISHQKLPFSMERLLIETASALQKELLMLHPGRPRDLYDNKGGGVHHNQRGGPRRPPRSSRSSAGATTEALLDRSRSLRGHAECYYDNVSGGLSSSYASALRHPELLTNNSSQLGGGAVGRTVSFASNDSSLGSGSGSALTSFEDTVAGASGGGAPGTSRKQNRSFAEFPKVQQQELIAPYRQDVRQVIENMFAPLKSKTGGGGSGGRSDKSTGLSERSGLVQQPSMTTLKKKAEGQTSQQASRSAVASCSNRR